MRHICVYDGDDLAAVFAFGAGPVYYGAAGQRVRELVNTPHDGYDPIVGRLYYGGLRDDTWPALITTVLSGLRGSGFRSVVHGMPEPGEVLPGVLY
jgi:hypothetical protein